MQLLITRHPKTLETMDGTLTIDGSLPLCDTSENAAAALPAGSYRLTIVKCRQYGRKMPVITPSPSPSPFPPCSSCPQQRCLTHNSRLPQVCHMLKPGNGICHRQDGSIIVGTRIGPGCLKHSKKAFDTLYERIRKSLERGNEVTLNIRDAL